MQSNSLKLQLPLAQANVLSCGCIRTSRKTCPHMIRLAFAGTAEIGVPLLSALATDPRFQIPLVVTQPDQPAGRKMELTAPAIKVAAQALGLPVFQPERLSSSAALEKISALEPDLMLVMAYGQILKKVALDLPKKGCLNVHTSLLPKYRGASPIQSALLKRDRETGITLIRMEEGMDTGPILASFAIPIAEGETAATLHHRLAQLSGQRIPDALEEFMRGGLSGQAQNESEASACGKISKEDGRIDWSEPAEVIEAKIRAFTPWPSAFTFFQGQRLKLLRAALAPYPSEGILGSVLRVPEGIAVQAGSGLLLLRQVQLEGKKPQGIEEFLRGQPSFLGARL